MLEHKGAIVGYHDPFIPNVNGDISLQSQPLTKELLQAQDCVVITADHSNIDYEFVAENSKLIFDTRNATKDLQLGNSAIHAL